MVFSLLWQCFRGPHIFRIHQERLAADQAGYEYNILERLPNNLLGAVRFCVGVVKWTIPVWLMLAKRRGLFAQEEVFTSLKFCAGMMLLCFIALAVRAVGRAINPSYREFMRILQRAQQAYTTENSTALLRYDFDFKAWPVTYDVRKYSYQQSDPALQVCAATSTPNIFLDVLGWLLTHTLGIRMVYPGCTGILGMMVRPALTKARAELRNNYPQLERHKIITKQGDCVEIFFVDRRGEEHLNSDTLMICCEGNAGFPEIGCPLIALEKGYSVLGWNHPGFAGSTGLPYPDKEQAAIDAIMKFARFHLKFELEKTGLLAWSIGGYTATWAAMNYPAVAFIILDATFDNIELLAQKAMPSFASGLVRHTIQRFINLNNVDQLCMYRGAVKLVRRSMDEMISTSADPNEQLKTNRGNNLLLLLLANRYPILIANEKARNSLVEWLHCQDESARQRILERHDAVHGGKTLLMEYLRRRENDSVKFPLLIGTNLHERQCVAVLLFLAVNYMVHQESSHCTPLKVDFLSTPFREKDLLEEENESAVTCTNSSSSVDGEEWVRLEE